jgi:hypothetical protein
LTCDLFRVRERRAFQATPDFVVTLHGELRRSGPVVTGVELLGRVTAAIPRAALVFLTPVVAVEQQPKPMPWDTDYWLRRFPDHEQA